MAQIEVCTDQIAWDSFVLGNGGHPLQLWGWGQLKSAHRWSAERVFLTDRGTVVAAASILFRKFPGGLGELAYVPRGPVFADGHSDPLLQAEVCDALAKHVKSAHPAIALSVEPDLETFQAGNGWKPGKNQILPARTLILDLTRSEDELLSAMSKKTRQYIRKSGGEDLEIRQVTTREQLEACMEVYHQTAERAEFGLHEDSYYFDAFEFLGEHSPVWASYQGDSPVAFLWLATSDTTSFELYGGMNPEGQRLRANFALKWHAITAMKARGVTRYDFGGLINDGVTTFKKSFADHETQLAGTFDKQLSPLYPLFTTALPTAKKVARKIAARKR